MTEYTAASEAVRAFMSSRERTAYWVRTHSPTGVDFYSPSVQPAELPPTPTSPPSEIESSHSLPPKMVLKYKDGRDIPISHWHYEGNNAMRSATKRSHNGEAGFHGQSHGHTRSRSYNAAVDSDPGRLGRNGSHRYGRQREMTPPIPHSPEEIRVWPSDSDEVPQTLPRSKSLPRDAHVHQDRSPPPPLPPLQTMYPPPPHHVQPLPPHGFPGPRIPNPRPRPVAWHSLPPQNLPSARPAPAIVYAPSHHSKPHYSPPALYPTYTHKGAEGMRQTRSAPVRYPGAGEPPFPLVHGTATSLSSVNEERRSRRSGSKSRPPTPSERDSHDSGSTYYVLPTPGQKVHVIAPDKSIYTATSTTKSPTSPSLRKPFFHRLFEMFSPSDSSKGSSTGGRRLQRRHSTGRHRTNGRRVH